MVTKLYGQVPSFQAAHNAQDTDNHGAVAYDNQAGTDACVVVVVQIDIVDSIAAHVDGMVQNLILHRFQAAFSADPFSMTWNYIFQLGSIRIVSFGSPTTSLYHCDLQSRTIGFA